MNTDQILVTCLIAGMIAVLYSRMLTPPVIFIGAAAFLVFTGILTPAQSLAGFANESIAVMIILLVMSQIIWRTGFVQWLFGVLINLRGLPQVPLPADTIHRIQLSLHEQYAGGGHDDPIRGGMGQAA